MNLCSMMTMQCFLVDHVDSSPNQRELANCEQVRLVTVGVGESNRARRAYVAWTGSPECYAWHTGQNDNGIREDGPWHLQVVVVVT